MEENGEKSGYFTDIVGITAENGNFQKYQKSAAFIPEVQNSDKYS